MHYSNQFRLFSLIPLMYINNVIQFVLSTIDNRSKTFYLDLADVYLGNCSAGTRHYNYSFIDQNYCNTSASPCEVSIEILPYRWFRCPLLVPTVAMVHFLNLKALVCILISMGSTWDIGTKCRYVIPQGFGSQMCTIVRARPENIICSNRP